VIGISAAPTPNPLVSRTRGLVLEGRARQASAREATRAQWASRSANELAMKRRAANAQLLRCESPVASGHMKGVRDGTTL